MTVLLGDVVVALEGFYPLAWAQSWDAVGLVVGDPSAVVRKVLFAVDPVEAVVAEAAERGADLLITHHPLYLRGTSTVAATDAKGRSVHRLIAGGCALYVAHTNADVACPGVSDALAAAVGLLDLRPLRPMSADAGEQRGLGRIGRLPEPLTVAELTTRVAGALPATSWGVRASGDPLKVVETLAVCGGAGDDLLREAADAGADAFLTADLRHHPASEAPEGLALLDAAHWATEWPWLLEVAARIADATTVDTAVSTLVTDPWTTHARSTTP
ncbi:MAG: Nif3-like dinuclear metal center hexameric protein [Mycobacteriales bacterium]